MTSSTDKAYEYIKSAVMHGEYQAGDRVKEEVIAERLGISRTPIRHALQKLAAQGFLEMLHNQGARVVEWSSQDLTEITDLRALLEGFGARIAARKIRAEQIEELKRLAAEMEQAATNGSAADLEAITELNSEFHMTILDASGNRRLAEVIGNLAHPLLVQRRFTGFSEDRLHRSMMHHRDIIDALENGQEDRANAAMQAHILASLTSEKDDTTRPSK